MKRYAVIVHEALKESAINFVAYLPDDQIHDGQKLITEDKDFTTVGVTNEGEAFTQTSNAVGCSQRWAAAVFDFHATPPLISSPLCTSS
jgi:sulfopyruvate decarboxylase TPP-binding subunit